LGIRLPWKFKTFLFWLSNILRERPFNLRGEGGFMFFFFF
jgi:hypothetical protein